MPIDRASLVGLAVWVFSFVTWGSAVSGAGWIVVLLIFSCAVLMPISLGLVPGDPLSKWTKWAMVVAALAVVVSFRREAGPQSAMLILPWLAVCGWMAFRAALNSWRVRGSLTALTLQSARGFPFVGAAWLLASRAGWLPFGFDPLIVLLTAAHFHHAGFTLPILAGKVSEALPGCWSRLTCATVLAGVPLVAAGITATHFGVLAWVEPVAVSLVFIGSVSVAVLHVKLALVKPRSGVLPRLFWGLAAISHAVAMALALGFGLRSLLPALALPMPQMWAIHGSLNAFGFGFLGLSGWLLTQSRSH